MSTRTGLDRPDRIGDRPEPSRFDPFRKDLLRFGQTRKLSVGFGYCRPQQRLTARMPRSRSPRSAVPCLHGSSLCSLPSRLPSQVAALALRCPAPPPPRRLSAQNRARRLRKKRPRRRRRRPRPAAGAAARADRGHGRRAGLHRRRAPPPASAAAHDLIHSSFLCRLSRLSFLSRHFCISNPSCPSCFPCRPLRGLRALLRFASAAVCAAFPFLSFPIPSGCGRCPALGAGLSTLRTLDLSGCSLTSAGLEHIAGAGPP